MRSSRVLAEKVKTEKRMVSQKDSNEQEEKAHREKGQATRRCPIPPPHALRIFFLLHVFLMSVQQFENFFDDRRVHLQWCVKRATTVWSAKACTCYVVVCASRHFLARKRRSWRRRRRWWRWVRVSGGRRYRWSTNLKSLVVLCLYCCIFTTILNTRE